MIQLSKRQSRIVAHCERMQLRSLAIRSRRELMKRDALAICRKPATLGAAFVTGGLAAYFFHPGSSTTQQCEDAGDDQATLPEDAVKLAGKMAVVKSVSALLHFLPRMPTSTR